MTLPVAAFAAPTAWEQVAIDAVTAMNKGNGERFYELAHPDLLSEARATVRSIFEEKNEPDVIAEMLAAYGVQTVDELFALEDKPFVVGLVRYIHANMPAESQWSLANAKLSILESKEEDGKQLVSLQMDFFAEGKGQSTQINLWVAQSEGTWKYIGEKQSKYH